MASRAFCDAVNLPALAADWLLVRIDAELPRVAGQTTSRIIGGVVACAADKAVGVVGALDTVRNVKGAE